MTMAKEILQGTVDIQCVSLDQVFVACCLHAAHAPLQPCS